MARTINGKDISEVFETLRTILKKEDYSFTENTGYPYIKESVLKNKFFKVVGFNFRQKPIAVDGSGSFVKILDVEGKKVVVTCMELQILDDDGVEVAKTSHIGTCNIALKKDGSGIVDLCSDIKAAETDSLKRAIYDFCPKPYDYADLKDDTSEPERFCNDNNFISLQILKSASFLNNGMITCTVLTPERTEIDMAIFSNTVSTISASLNCSPEQLATKLCAGTCIKATVNNGSYNGKKRLNCSKIIFTGNNSNNSTKSYNGIVSIKGSASVINDSITVPISIAGSDAILNIDNNKCKDLLSICNISSIEQLAGNFRANQSYEMSVKIKSNGEANFICFTKAKEAKR